MGNLSALGPRARTSVNRGAITSAPRKRSETELSDFPKAELHQKPNNFTSRHLLWGGNSPPHLQLAVGEEARVPQLERRSARRN
eukprot:1619250-Pyramimonas_sp.AAC.1